MPRVFVFAALCAASANDVAYPLEDSCMGEAIPFDDENSMLQGVVSRLHISAEGASDQISSASDALATVWSLVDAIKQGSNDISNITLAAKDYASIVELDVIPNIEAALGEIDNLLATQREFVKQCDARLREGVMKGTSLHHIFLEKRSLHKACASAESVLAADVADCLHSTAVQAECSHFEASLSEKTAQCADLQAAVDAAACAQASHSRNVCKEYGDCRANSMAVYQNAAKSLEKRTHGQLAELDEAKRARCIASSLVDSAGDVDSMMKLIKGCDDIASDEKDSSRFSLVDVDAMPPSLACENTPAHQCVDDFVELDLGRSVTWRSPCASCPAMARMAVPPVSPPISWLSSFGALLSSAKNLTQATIDPRQRSAMTVSLIGVGDKVIASSLGQSASTGQYVAILIAVPLVALGIALGVAVACSPGLHSNRSGELSPTRRPGSSLLRQRDRKEMPSPKVADPRPPSMHSVGSFHDRPSLGGGHAYGNFHDRPSLGGGHAYGNFHSPPFSQSHSPFPTNQRVSLPPNLGAPVGHLHQPSGLPGGLCPELMVPEGSECILGIPSLSNAPQGEVMLKNITDKTGEALLYVGLTAAPAGGEYVLLAKKDQQELAFCELGSSVESEGWNGKIFRWDGELYARIREESPLELGRLSSGISGAHRTFAVLSAVGAPWQLRVTGDFKEQKLCVEDDSRCVVAMVSPGNELAFSHAGEFCKLRLGPQADSCTVIVALLAIERLLGF